MKFINVLLTIALPIHGCFLPSEIQAERERTLHGKPTTRASFLSVKRNASTDYGLPIGKGDRFRNGTVTPVGIGVAGGNAPSFSSILNMEEVPSALEGLKNGYPEEDVKLFTGPHLTYENRSVYGLSVGDPRVYIQGGIHARERGATDHVLYFVADLLYAKKHNQGLTYGEKTYSHMDVKTALSAGVAIVPALNPDGITYDQTTNSCWRKNRNPRSAKPNEPDSVGIDLNRNYDFLWHYRKAFNASAHLADVASDNPSSSIFHGTSPASEPETKNSAWTMGRFPALSWFIDVHSFSGVVLYMWGDDNPQISKPYMNFRNHTYDGKRGFIGKDPRGSVYREYVESSDLHSQNITVQAMSSAMTLGSGGKVPYQAVPVASFYATSGGSNDFAMSGYYGHECGANRIQGLGVEFGNDSGIDACPFYPMGDQYRSSMRQMGAGLMELMLRAAGKAGEVKRWDCGRQTGYGKMTV